MNVREIAGRGGRGPATVVVRIVAALLVSVLLVWWLAARVGQETTLASEKEARGPEPSRGVQPLVDDGVAAEKPEPGERTEIADVSTLIVDVLDKGEPAEGRAVWAFSADPLQLEPALPPTAPDLVLEGRDDGLGRAAVSGKLQVSIPAGKWTRLRVRSVESPAVVRHVRVPPFRGERALRVDLGSETRVLHVQAWDSSLTRPLDRADVHVRWEPLGGAGDVRDLTVRTDEWGQGSVDLPAPGAILVRAPSARPSDPAPACVRLVASPYDAVRELSCAVVEPPVRHKLTLPILVDEKLAGSHAKLFVRRMDAVAGDLVAQRGELMDAHGTIELEVPAGFYEFGVVPLGTARVEPKTVRIDGDRTLPVQVVAETEQFRVRLEGIPRRYLPIQVVPQEEEDLAGLDPALLFVGPYHWTSPEASIAGVPPGSRLLALARQAVFLSTRPLVLPLPASSSEPGGTTVPMEPASLLSVEWVGGPLRHAGGVVLQVHAGELEALRAMVPRLTTVERVLRPVWSCTFAVPRGPVELIGIGADGDELWRRQIRAEEPRQWVRFDTP